MSLFTPSTHRHSPHLKRHLSDSLSVHRRDRPSHSIYPSKTNLLNHSSIPHDFTHSQHKRQHSTLGNNRTTTHFSLGPHFSVLQRQWRLPRNSTSLRATRTSSPKCRPSCPRRPSTCARKPWIWSRSRAPLRRFRGIRRSGLRRRYVFRSSVLLMIF
jgi:hypothetical protein